MNEVLKKNIKICAKRWGLNISEMSAIFGLGQHGITNIFSGRKEPPEGFIRSLAEKCNTKATDMLTREIEWLEISEILPVSTPENVSNSDAYNILLREIQKLTNEIREMRKSEVSQNELNHAQKKIISLQERLLKQNNII